MLSLENGQIMIIGNTGSFENCELTQLEKEAHDDPILYQLISNIKKGHALSLHYQDGIIQAMAKQI